MKIKIIFLILTFINLLFSINSIAYCRLAWPDEYFIVAIQSNGDVYVNAYSLLDEASIDLFGLGVASVDYISGLWIDAWPYTQYLLKLKINTLTLSLDEAESVGDELANKIAQQYFDAESKYLNRTVVNWMSPTGERISFVMLNYKLVNVNFDKIIDFMLKIKPKKGFIAFIDRQRLNKAYNIEIAEVYDDGKWYHDLYVTWFYKKYYTFKAGATYILDLFNMLNVTGSLVSKSKSTNSMITMLFERPGNLDYVFSEVYFSKANYNINRRREDNVVTGYEITANLSGKNIDDIRVKFKLVERGFNPYSSAYGIAMILIVFIIFGLIFFSIYKLQYKK